MTAEQVKQWRHRRSVPSGALALALSVCALMLPAAAKADNTDIPAACAEAPEPVIEVRLDENPVRQNSRRSAVELTTMARDQALRPRAGSHVSGLTVTSSKIKLAMPSRVYYRNNDIVCAAPERVVLTIETWQTVYVGREYAADACWNAVVERHENEHVDINQRAYRAMERVGRHALEIALDRLYTQAGGAGSLRSEAALDGLRAALLDSAQAAMREEQSRAIRSHQAIDTPSNYRRINRMCQQTPRIRALQDIRFN